MREDIDHLTAEVDSLKERIATLESGRSAEPTGPEEPEPAQAEPQPSTERSPVPGILMLVFGIAISMSGWGILIGVPLAIVGIILLVTNSPPATPSNEAEPEEPTDEPDEPTDAAREPDSNVVLRILTIIGVLALVLGAVFFLTLSIQNGWLSKPVQLLIGVLTGLIIAIIGSHMRRKESYAFWGDIVTTGGTIIIYFTVYAAYTFDDYRAAIGLSAAVLGIALMCIAGLFLAYAATLGNRRITIASMALGTITFLFADMTLVSLMYVLILGIGTRVAGAIHAWPWISSSSIVLASLGVLVAGAQTDALAGVLSLGALVAVTELLVIARKERDDLLGIVPLVPAGLILLWFARSLAWDVGITSIVYAALLLGLSALNTSNARTGRALSAAAFIAIGSGLLVSPEYIALTWAALSLVLAYAAMRFDTPAYRIMGHVIAGIGFVAVLTTNIPEVVRSSWPAVLALPSFYLTITMSAAYVMLSNMQRGVASGIYSGLATLLIVVLTFVTSTEPLATVSVLMGLAIIYRMLVTDPVYHVMSLVLSGLAILTTLILDTIDTAGVWTYAIAIASIAALNLYTRTQRLEEGMGWVIPLGVAIISLLIMRLVTIFGSGAGITLGWLAAGIIGLIIGISASDRIVRLAGLGLIGCAVIKAFFADVFALELVWRVVAFIVLGIALLTAALLYGRFRERIGELF